MTDKLFDLTEEEHIDIHTAQAMEDDEPTINWLRDQEVIERASNELDARMWLDRASGWQDPRNIKAEMVNPTPPEIAAKRDEAIVSLTEKYGDHTDLSAFESGVLLGECMALRWVLGHSWGWADS